MELGDANDVRPVPAAREAGEVLGPAFVLWLAVLALYGGGSLAFVYLLERATPALYLTIYEGVTVVAAVVIARFAWRDRDACRVFVRPRRGMFELCLLAGIVGAMVLAWWESGIVSSLPSPIAIEQQAGFPWWVCLLASALVPAVFEELAYRGVILARLRRVVSTKLAVAVQAMMFSMMHTDPVYVLPHFAFGCLAGFLRVAAGASWPCMLLHFCWNGWLVLEQYELV